MSKFGGKKFYEAICAPYGHEESKKSMEDGDGTFAE